MSRTRRRAFGTSPLQRVRRAFARLSHKILASSSPFYRNDSHGKTACHLGIKFQTRRGIRRVGRRRGCGRWRVSCWARRRRIRLWAEHCGRRGGDVWGAGWVPIARLRCVGSPHELRPGCCDTAVLWQIVHLLWCLACWGRGAVHARFCA